MTYDPKELNFVYELKEALKYNLTKHFKWFEPTSDSNSSRNWLKIGTNVNLKNPKKC